MKTKIFLSSIIVILLAIIGLAIGFNWDIVKAKFNKEELYTTTEVALIKSNSLEKITSDELLDNIYTFSQEEENLDINLKFNKNGTVDMSAFEDGQVKHEYDLTLNYSLVDGVCNLFNNDFNGYNIDAMILKSNNELRFYMDRVDDSLFYVITKIEK